MWPFKRRRMSYHSWMAQVAGFMSHDYGLSPGDIRPGPRWKELYRANNHPAAAARMLVREYRNAIARQFQLRAILHPHQELMQRIAKND